MPDRIDELEAQAAVHRAGLAQALAGLAQGTQPAALMGSDLAQGLAKTALDTAKRNPLGAALVGVGLAMLIAKGSKPAEATAPEAQPAPQPQADPEMTQAATAEEMRLNLHGGLGHLPPEARKRVIRKRIEALEAQEEVEKRPTDPLGVLKAHKGTVALTLLGLGAAAAVLWPRKGFKAQARRDQLLRAAEAQLQVEEARMHPFPEDTPSPQADQTNEPPLRNGHAKGHTGSTDRPEDWTRNRLHHGV